jgi:sugar phosphate isomerase/epimerase
VYVACSTLCFAQHPLDRALRLINDMEFGKVDIALREKGPHLKPSEIAKDVGAAAQHIRFSPSLAPAAFNVEIEATDAEEFQKQLRAICRLARLSTVPVITMPAGPNTTTVDQEVVRLKPLVKLAQSEGIVLTLATRVGTLTEMPETAAKLCAAVPGLGLTLDPSHYQVGPGQGQSYECVYPYVRHVHLRDTGRRPDQFQVKVGQGQIEYGKIVSQLDRVGYDRLLTVDIHAAPDAPYEMESEVRKLKFLLESLV